MVIIALSDIHDNIKRLEAITYDLSTADIVLLVGDLTNFGRKEAASKVVRAVQKYNDCVLAVPGNCDYPEVDAYLTGEGINLHRKSITIGEINFLGVGGSLPCPSKTPNELTEDELGEFLRETASNLNPDTPMILVSHQPPRNTVTDFARNGKHVGSESICNFIIEVQPIICFTGHIHEGRGIDAIGKTKVVNPGSLREGGYAYAEVNRQVDVLEIRGIDGV
jgi:Icc-related predicted phosphoesterase